MASKHGFLRSHLGRGFPVATLSYSERVRQASVVSLFGATVGFFFDPSDLSTLFQVSDGTTPVAADSDPVGYHADLSPNGFHRVQATAAARPLYKTSGGLSWLLYQGTDDRLTNAAAQLPLTNFTWFGAFEETSAVNNAGVLTIHPASGNDFDRTDALSIGTGSSVSSSYVGIGGSTGMSLADFAAKPSPLRVYEVVKNGGTATLYINGVQKSQDTSYTAFDALSAGGFTMGRRFISGAGSAPYLIGRERLAFFIGRVLTDSERAMVRAYAAQRAGLAL